MSRLLNSTLLGAAALATLTTLTTPTSAQSLYGIDANGGVTLAVEMTGPSAGPCGYPNGPFGAAPFATTFGACPGPVAFGSGYPGTDGDIAVNKTTDTVWVAGAFAVGEYDLTGGQISGFFNPLPGTVTGLGMNSAAGTLWLTNGNQYVELAPGCPTPAVVAGPFVSPITAPMTDIDYDSATGSLWACFEDGRVANFFPGGLSMCTFDSLAVGLNPPVVGLAIDATSGAAATNALNVVVTDGVRIAHLRASGGACGGAALLAPPSFAFPNNLYPVPGGPLSGLAYAAHGTTFGGGTGPEISLDGQSVVGLPGTSIDLTGAAPGDAALFFNVGLPLCPPIAFKGLPMHVAPTFLLGPIAHGGAVSLPAMIPPGTPAGIEIFAQWFNRAPGLGWESTPGMVITASRP